MKVHLLCLLEVSFRGRFKPSVADLVCVPGSLLTSQWQSRKGTDPLQNDVSKCKNKIHRITITLEDSYQKSFEKQMCNTIMFFINALK